MAGTLGIAGSVLSLAPAGAQADPEPVQVEATAYFVRNAGAATPNTVTSEFPPGVVCVVAPEVCPEDLAPVTGPLGGAIGTVENAPEEPAGTVEPGTLPVSVDAGEERYSSAVLLTLPEVPAGQEVGQFILRLEQIQPSYHSSSPAYRQAVLATVASAGCKCFNQEEYEKLQQSAPVEREQFLGVEACPTTEAFAGDDFGQPENAKPGVDCLFGANGVKADGSNVWEFDLTFAAEAWYSGAMENNGVLLRTTGAPNLAFGDPDTSTYSRVTFSADSATAEVEQRPESSPPAPFTPPSNTNSGSGSSSPSFSTPSSSGNIFAPPANFTPEAAEVADAEPQVADDAPNQQVVAAPIFDGSQPLTPWWIWLLVPIFLAGMYLTAQSLTTEVVLASERQGAMMRLIDQRGGTNAGRGPSGPRQGALSRLTGQK